MEDEICEICGDSHKEKYCISLKCDHIYHYECIQKTFTYDRKKENLCPQCRKPSGLLPIVNGLPKLIKGIHFYNLDKGLPKVNNMKCVTILKSGKRKGCECNAKCMIGMNVCKRHYQIELKKEI